jgi:hypothetical protein
VLRSLPRCFAIAIITLAWPANGISGTSPSTSRTRASDSKKLPKDFYATRSYTDFLIDAIREDRAEAAKRMRLVSESAKTPDRYRMLKAWDSLSKQQQALESRGMEVYAGMVDNMDYHFGRVVKFLKDIGEYDNTIVIFLYDNGPNPWVSEGYPGNRGSTWFAQFDNSIDNLGHPMSHYAYGIGWGSACAGPLDLFKMPVGEGGIRCPLLIAGPGVKGGRQVDAFAYVWDIMPTVLDDVTNAAFGSPLLVGPAHSTTSFDAGRLEFDKTYFWRVDEVSAPPGGEVFEGSVWSFTTESLADTISGENITVTASSANRDDEGPDNTINGSGLNDADLHSLENAAMWLSSGTDANSTWIQYEFDRIHKLYQMWVWNYNSSVEPLVGFGVKEALIEYSVDGTDWATLGTAHEFAKGPGEPGYASNTTVDLSGVAAKHIRITANSNWGGILSQFGLSEVRFLSVPVQASKPGPDSGATGVDVDAILSFRAGRDAATHDVYLSTDEQTVIDGTAPVATVTDPSYAPSLDLATTYYWRVDEVNDAETPAIWQGDLWNFTTEESIVVDDFESYNDTPAAAIENPPEWSITVLQPLNDFATGRSGISQTRPV